MTKKLLLIIFLLTASFSFSQDKLKDKLLASPNPFSNQTTIYFNTQLDQDVILTVKNVLGKTVFKQNLKVSKGKNVIPFYRNDLKSGMYIYAIQSREKIISKRFVIR
ncbi:hypothetical protein WH52_05350 [Tenacibaculum holothuriorum]|uniref:Secretion system C-terminal sorting domain-containing protein n=1 Tax=Tenacibaculum holothuriorum TaxID=1635173 RepID=A0A1Y2PDZ3_9FLAO|nr:T9SS type A sorting domain-containing protein [Tenacibaculum holothuriorum]OSY88211.1 hypothetical protein WH52_05350 [Tenacibaculum holothuriorum]